jgi:hypothetical protein
VNHGASVYAIDVDGDLDMDVLSASANDNKIAWYENDGYANFTTHIITTDASGAVSVYAIDVDNDGDTDVLSASVYDNKIAWYENSGNENFTPHIITTSAVEPWSVYAIDIDGDEDIDVLSTSIVDGKLALYKNDGNENFTRYIIGTYPIYPSSVYAADVDSDGDIDVLSAHVLDDQISWFENKGTIPVELTSFTANVNTEGNVLLNWTTATELNNQMFEIERRSKEAEFITIGYVDGYGTTTELQEYAYLDKTVVTGTHFYRLKQIDFGGQYEYSDEIEIDVIDPLTFVLAQNYPNPFNPSTNIKYSVAKTGSVKLAVYNLVGEEVNVLVSGQVNAGFYEIVFDASSLPSGIYFYKLQAGSFVETKKMVIIK